MTFLIYYGSFGVPNGVPKHKFLYQNLVLEWNPRGQVAPQVIVTNVATKQTDKGVAPQSPLEESATTSARWPVRNRVTFGVVSRPGSPFLSVFFSEIANEFFTKIIEKGADKKKEQTDKDQDIFGRISSSAGTVF